MNKFNFKIFLHWFVVFFICLTLFFTTFIPGPFSVFQKNSIKIDNYKIIPNDLDNLILNIIKNKKKIKKIDNIDLKLKILVKNNILFNIDLLKSGLIASKKEIFDTLFKNKLFNINGYFSIESYNLFLKKNNLTDFEFQNFLKKQSIQNQIKKCLFFINKNYNFKKKEYLKFVRNNIDVSNFNLKKNINFKKQLDSFFLNNCFYFKCIEFSFKSFKNIVSIKKNKILNFYNEKKYFYSKQDIFEIDLNFLNNNFDKKIIFITADELSNSNKLKFFSLLKEKQEINILNKEFNFNKINRDLLNKYRKQKIFNYIRKNISNFNKEKTILFLKKKKIKFNSFNLFDTKSKVLLKSFLKNRDFKNLIKINNNKYLFLKPFNNYKKKDFFIISSFFDLFINKKSFEKNFLIEFLKFKKNKRNDFDWISEIENKKEFFRIINKLKFSKDNNTFIRYKDFYYLIKNFYFSSFLDDLNDQYSIIKKINEKYN